MSRWNFISRVFSQVKPRQAISIAAWVKLDTNKGYHSIFDTIGGHSLHQKGQYHFEVQDGSVRWFHRNESNVQIFSVETGKRNRETSTVAEYNIQGKVHNIS